MSDATEERQVDEPERQPMLTDPAAVVRDDLDAKILVGLWFARKSYFPLLWLGLTVAAGYFVVVRDPTAFGERIADLTTPGELIGALLSPFALVIAAIAMRIVVGLGALVAAYPLARGPRPDDYGHTNSIGRWWRSWWDRWKLSQSYRAFRWTWAVRSEVLERLDAWGSFWYRWDFITIWLNTLLFAAFFVVLSIIAAQAA